MKNIISIIVLSILLFSCESKKNAEQSNTVQKLDDIVTLTNEQRLSAGIEIGKLSSKNLSTILKVNGNIDVSPQSMVSISVPLGGYLKSTKLLVGKQIFKGEVLAVIEDAQFIQLQQDYLTAKAQFLLTESEYKRQKDLNQSKATSDKIFEQSIANYQTQNILVKSLEEKLKLIGINPEKLTPDVISRAINIYSPISGSVSKVNVNVGKYINPSDVLFELVNPDDILLKLTVFEKDVSKLAIGQKLFAYSNTNKDKKYICEIILIGKNLSDQNSAEVHARFIQSDKALMPGMFMSAEIQLTGRNLVSLPSDAIVRFENKQYAFVANENNSFKILEVMTGISENGFTELIEADSLTSFNFVTKGAYKLLMTIKSKGED